jgi:hypothetical protein
MSRRSPSRRCLKVKYMDENYLPVRRSGEPSSAPALLSPANFAAIARDMLGGPRPFVCKVRPSRRKPSVSWVTLTGHVRVDPASSGVVVVRHGGQIGLRGCEPLIACMSYLARLFARSLISGEQSHRWHGRAKAQMRRSQPWESPLSQRSYLLGGYRQQASRLDLLAA